MSRLAVDNISKTFSDGTRALDDVSFAVEPGEFFTVLGPTNAGKSTLLKLIAGLHAPSSGRVLIDGADASDLEPGRRGLSLMFQNIALFPNRTGQDNIAFPLRMAGMPEPEVASRVATVAAMVNVGHLLGRLPQTYSGGEQQRVAIARAVAAPSRVLMLDEPLTNLDARLRIALRMEFRALHRQSGQTIIYVTHDQTEAMSLSDRIMVLNAGRIEQIGTPDEIYHRPATRFVAEFIGTPPMNILPAAATGLTAQARTAVGIRPEHIDASPFETPRTPLSGEVVWIERLGSRNVLDIRIGGQPARVVVRPDHPLRETGQAWFGLPAERLHVLGEDGRRFIRSERSNI
ncbi:MAG: ABC transporter ATP-binding protein [Rhizobiaceae bacterium]|nr:ABC transporter ATP-binding protein [Rhizobiaceae bacterium]